MKKPLNQLSTEELGQLFPIEIVPYSDSWAKDFENEKNTLQEKLGEKTALRIEHFGSTAVNGLSAKPIIDILIEIPVLTESLKQEIISKMSELDYQFIWRTDNEIPYMNFVKGYTPEGFSGKTFHVHMADKNHNLWDRIYFRDYLRLYPEVAKQYENLKIELAEKYRFNREDYTEAKSDFIKSVTEKAVKELKN